MNDPIARAVAMLRATAGDRVHAGLSLAPLTTFRIGGPAAIYLEPQDEDDLAAAGRAIVETEIPFVVVGKGSNLLVSDRGFAGLVLRLGRGYRWVARDAGRLRAGAATPLPALAGVALQHGLAGLAFGVAIPATMGGAVKMNAGAHDGSMFDVVETVEVFRLRAGAAASIPAVDAGFTYRRSALPEDAVVCAATVALAPADPAQIRSAMDEARSWRRRTQPLGEPNCGSVFKNPSGDHAARLIEAAGMKGRTVGGARVSMKHANFIVARPRARAADVLTLIGEVQAEVERACGVRLEREVRLVGAFDDAA